MSIPSIDSYQPHGNFVPMSPISLVCALFFFHVLRGTYAPIGVGQIIIIIIICFTVEVRHLRFTLKVEVPNSNICIYCKYSC